MTCTHFRIHLRFLTLSGEYFAGHGGGLERCEVDPQHIRNGFLNADTPTSDGLVIEPKPKPLLPPSRPSPPSGGMFKKCKRKRGVTIDVETPSEPEDDSYKEFAFGSAGLLAAVLPEMSEGGAIFELEDPNGCELHR